MGGQGWVKEILSYVSEGVVRVLDGVLNHFNPKAGIIRQTSKSEDTRVKSFGESIGKPSQAARI